MEVLDNREKKKKEKKKRFAWYKVIIVHAKLQPRRPQLGERFDPIVSWN